MKAKQITLGHTSLSHLDEVRKSQHGFFQSIHFEKDSEDSTPGTKDFSDGNHTVPERISHFNLWSKKEKDLRGFIETPSYM